MVRAVENLLRFVEVQPFGSFLAASPEKVLDALETEPAAGDVVAASRSGIPVFDPVPDRGAVRKVPEVCIAWLGADDEIRHAVSVEVADIPAGGRVWADVAGIEFPADHHGGCSVETRGAGCSAVAVVDQLISQRSIRTIGDQVEQAVLPVNGFEFPSAQGDLFPGVENLAVVLRPVQIAVDPGLVTEEVVAGRIALAGEQQIAGSGAAPRNDFGGLGDRAGDRFQSIGGDLKLRIDGTLLFVLPGNL